MKLLKIYILILLPVSLLFAADGFAYRFELDSPLPANKLDAFLTDNINKIDIESGVLRTVAFENKIRLALDFEEDLEAHKAELRESGDYIYLLNEARSNLTRIQGLEAELADTERWLEDARAALISRHSDLSIPIAVAGIVEVPIKRDRFKGELFRDNVRNYILNTAGLAWITSEVKFENAELRNELIIESVRGTVEEDTTKTFDHELIERTGSTSKYFTVAFFRYRPFDFGKNMVTASPGGVRVENATVQLINVKDSSKTEIFAEINKQFSSTTPTFQSDLTTYLDNILRLEDKVDQSASRIEYVLNLVNTLKEKQHHRITTLEQGLHRLKQENSKIFNGIGLTYEPDDKAISLLINNKTKEMDKKRDSFVHHVILMDDSAARDFADGLSLSLKSIATRAKEMVERKSFDMESRVEGGTFNSTVQVKESRAGQIITIDVWPYMEGDRVGVLFDGQLRYPSVDETPTPGAVGLNTLGFSEEVDGIKVRMMALTPESADQATKFISEGEITKGQFAAFSENISRYLAKNCVARLGMRDYPERLSDDYPILCVNREGQSEFAAWLGKRTGLEYKVADDAAYRTNFDSKILKRISKGFRIFLPSSSGAML